MREGIGSIFLYNIIIVFVLLIFAFLAAIMSYNKAFVINSRIVSQIEKYEGYNNLSYAAIEKDLISIGYRRSNDGTSRCPQERRGATLDTSLNQDGPFSYCVYFHDTNKTKHNHYRYGVVTYISFDFPFLGTNFRLPIYSETDSMYNFSFGGN